MLRRLPALALVLLASCGGAECPSVDEATLRAQIREEVLEELRRDNREARNRAPAEPVAVALPDVERFRVDTAHAPRRGATQPLVTIVEFADFQCPFCSRAEPILERILAAYPDEVQLVYRHNPLPFHQDAMPAAEAALEAYDQGGDALFWRYHDLLFANQRALDRASLEAYAAQLGMDTAAFARALDSGDHRIRAEEDQRAAARVGARGTPGFFVNGRQLMGAQPFEAFDAVISEELRTARRLLEAGVPRRALYARLMEGAIEQASERPGDGAEPSPIRPHQPDPSVVYRVPVAGRPQLGPSDALVTVVEITDFQCPFCSRVQPTLEQVRQTYGRDVRIVLRHNPLAFHTDAMPAAEAAEEVRRQLGDEAFFRYAELLFSNQRALDAASLASYAAQVGANASEVTAALADGRHRATIAADQQLAASLGATGTPTFYVNGRQLRGAQPFAAFQALIDEERARAEALVRSGVRRGDVYDHRTRDGATSLRYLP